MAQQFVAKREKSEIDACLGNLETEPQRKALANYAAACRDLWTLVKRVLDQWNSKVKIFELGQGCLFEPSPFNVEQVGPGTEFSWFLSGQGFGSGEFGMRCYSPNRDELRLQNQLVIGCAQVNVGYAAWLWSPIDERGTWFKCSFKPGFYPIESNPELNKIYVSDRGSIDAGSAFLYESNVWNAAEIGSAVTESS